jgi:hypothetical protein
MTARRTKVHVTTSNRKAHSRLNAIESAGNKHTRQRTQDKRPRSAVTSGRKLFVNGDPNSAWARRFHDLIIGHVVDAGGRDVISEAHLSLIKRAAALECELELLEGRLSQGEQIDLDQYGRAAGQLRRILETVGLERRTKTIVPTIDQYAAQVRQRGGT